MTDDIITEATTPEPSAFDQFKAAQAQALAAKAKLSAEADELEERLRAIRKIVPKTRAPRKPKPDGDKPKAPAKAKK